MKYASGLFFFLLFAVAPCGAQTVNACELRSNEAPALFNLRLGMSPEDARAVFGNSLKIKIRKNGNRVFFQNFINEPAPPVLSGVRALYLRFFDLRLYEIEIFYEDKPEIKTLEDFTRYLSGTLKLPELWYDELNRQTIKCTDFTVVADKILNPRVRLIDDATTAKAEEFLEQQKQQKKKSNR
ncbi:MAG: hypothetical protein M3209_06760 [Acidobacteriota bacterium]|nr:hypothetical protein [Acidobacteriota bacterium]